LCILFRSAILAKSATFEQSLLLQLLVLDAKASLDLLVNPLKTGFNLDFSISVVIGVNFKLVFKVLHYLISALYHRVIKLLDESVLSSLLTQYRFLDKSLREFHSF
jgi:hypothetical protein